MNIPDPLLAAIFTVVGGAITFAFGQIFVKAILEPVHEVKREIARIAYSLDYYANQMFGDAPKADEARDAFRKHSCKLRELSSLVILYEAWIPLIGLPSQANIMHASKFLMGHSNRSRNPDPRFDRDHTKEIRRLLKIRHVDDFVKESQIGQI